MTASRFLPGYKFAVGSSYLVQQSPGAEVIGGLEVVLKHPKSPPGAIHISNTLWSSDETRDDLAVFRTAALDGIHQYAQRYDIDLTQFDIELRKWLFHDVDSRSHIFHITAQNAFQSALLSWSRQSSLTWD